MSYRLKKALIALFTTLMLVASIAEAKLSGDARKDAARLYQRLAGLPLRPENPLYLPLNQAFFNFQLNSATQLITDKTNGAVSFYEIVVRNLASTFNYKEASLQDPLNDFMALFNVIVRDSDGTTIKVDDLLLAPYLYRDSTVTGTNAYNAGNNTHYQFIANRAAGFARQLSQFTPTDYTHVGAFDTRAFGLDYYQGGTLRRPFEALIQRFFAVSQKSVIMAALPADGYRRDFPVAVAGMPIELNESPKCIGCHRSMDPATRVFLDRHWNATTTRLVPFAATATGFDQVNEVNRPENIATSTAGKLYVTKEMNDRVFGYQGLTSQGSYLEANLGNLRDLMNFVVNARGFHRALVKRIVFYMFTGRLFVLSEVSENDENILKQVEPIIERLTDSLMNHRNLRRTFEEAAAEWMSY